MNWLQKLSSGPYNQILWHGTNKQFDSFDLSFAGARDWGDFGVGVYLSDRASLAVMYAEEAVKNNGGGEPVVYKIQANLTNVADYDELMEVVRTVGSPENKDTSIIGPSGLQSRPEVDSRAITQQMVEKGFDAARIGIQFVVYDPSLLKVVRVLSTEDASYMP